MQEFDFDKIVIIRLNHGNFSENSLDNFILKQKVTKCWRKTNGSYALVPVCYTEQWSLSECKKTARKILCAMQNGSTALAAVADHAVIGFALLSDKLFGSGNQYVDLAEFYVSEPYRRRGIGKKLFDRICMEARRTGAKKLYISAHSAEESIAAYKKYGCVFAEEPSAAHIEKEPFDLQLEYSL